MNSEKAVEHIKMLLEYQEFKFEDKQALDIVLKENAELKAKADKLKEKLKNDKLRKEIQKIKMINEDNARFEYAEEILDLLEV